MNATKKTWTERFGETEFPTIEAETSREWLQKAAEEFKRQHPECRVSVKRLIEAFPNC